MASQEALTVRPDIPKDKLVLYVRKDETWYHEINPYRQLPAIEDVGVFEAGSGQEKRLNVFDSTSILVYLCDKYDKDGLYIGKNPVERAQVMNWLIAYTAGLGATGEWWLKLRGNEELAPALNIIEAAITREYDILEKRLGEPGQKWVALADRPTLADLAIQPLANPTVAKNAKIDFDDWPKTKAWSEAVDAIPFVQRAMLTNSRLGMTEAEIQEHGR